MDHEKFVPSPYKVIERRKPLHRKLHLKSIEYYA